MLRFDQRLEIANIRLSSSKRRSVPDQGVSEGETAILHDVTDNERRRSGSSFEAVHQDNTSLLSHSLDQIEHRRQQTGKILCIAIRQRNPTASEFLAAENHLHLLHKPPLSLVECSLYAPP